MGAFNYLVVPTECPACRSAVDLAVQFHIAASFAGLDGERFHGKTYRVGERMRWWPSGHPDFAKWRWCGRQDMSGLADDEDEQLCEVECPRCRGELIVLLRVKDFVPCVLAIHGPPGPDGDDWGAGYTGGYLL